MTTQLNFSAAPSPLSALVGAGLPDAKGAPDSPSSTAGSHFAELFTGHMLKLERQGFAAEQDALGGLQVMPLGPSINVITSDAPVPDMQSLVAFAKAQGLDEAAVAGLFGDMPGLNQPVSGVPALAGTAGVAASLSAQLAATPALTAPTFALASAATPLPTLGMLQAISGVSIQGFELSPKSAPGEVLSPVSTADVLATLGVSAAKEDVAPLPSVTGAATAPSNVDVAAAQAAALQAVGAVAVVALPQQASAVQDLTAPEAVAVTPEAPAMVDALRVQMGIPSADITRRLAELAGLRTTVSWADLVAQAGARQKAQIASPTSAPSADGLAAQGGAMGLSAGGSAVGRGPDAALAMAILPASMNGSSGNTAQVAASAADLAGGLDLQADLGAAPEEESLRIEVPPDLDLGAMLEQAGAPSEGVGTVRHGSIPAAAAPSQAASADGLRAQIQEREAQTQVLADRMGVAMANKLMNQIERGQWKLQMRLQPGTLGRVEVALDMHAGGLDAVFSTDNALTKELLGHGSQRLRDALTQSGTTVASVTVNADSRGQSGGNSTPQKRQPAPQQSAPTVAARTAPARAARYTAGVAEGLNVLA